MPMEVKTTEGGNENSQAGNQNFEKEKKSQLQLNYSV